MTGGVIMLIYEQPRLDIIPVEEDVITTSNPNPDDGEIDWG